MHFSAMHGLGAPVPAVVARTRPTRHRSVPAAETWLTASDMALVQPYAEPIETQLPKKAPKGLVPKSGITVTGGEIDWIEATSRFLVWKGHPIKRAKSIADVAVALSELRRSGPGRKRLGPHLYKRGGWIHMTDGFERKSTSCPVIGEDWRDDVGANARLAVMVEKRVRRVLGRILKKDVLISEMFAVYLLQNTPGPGADVLTKNRHAEITNHLAHLESFMGSNTLDDLGQNSGKQYLEWATDLELKTRNGSDHDDMSEVRYVARSTARQHVVTLVMVTNWYCGGENRIEPIRIAIPKVRRTGVEFLTVEEIIRLISAARGRIYDEAGKIVGHHDKRARYECVIRFILIYLYGGTRHKNILLLTWFQDDVLGHINPELDFIERQGGLAEITFKRRGTSFLIGSLRELALRWKAEDAEKRKAQPGRYVHIIHDAEGKPIADVGAERSSDVGKRMQRLFDEVRTLAGLPNAKPHQLKHAGVTYAVRAGMPLHEVELAFSTSMITLWTYYVHLQEWFNVQPAGDGLAMTERRQLVNNRLKLLALRRLSSKPLPPGHA
jgi:integrase